MKRMATLSLLLLTQTALAAPGFIFDSVPPRTDALIFEEFVYTGPCPGVRLNPVRGYFFNPDVPTAEGRRVRIVNVTPGMETSPYPFTDRAYDNGQRSDKIDFLLGSKHRQRWFSVADGLNTFQVTFTDGGRVIETQQFTFPVSILTTYETRLPVCRVEPVCTIYPPSGRVCSPRTVCACPID